MNVGKNSCYNSERNHLETRNLISNFQTSKRKIKKLYGGGHKRGKKEKKDKTQVSVIMKNANRLHILVKDKDCQTKLQKKSSSILCTIDIWDMRIWKDWKNGKWYTRRIHLPEERWCDYWHKLSLSGRNITRDKEGHHIITRIMSQFLSLKVFKIKTENHKSWLMLTNLSLIKQADQKMKEDVNIKSLI